MINLLRETVGDDRLEEGALLKEHTSFKIGGPADILIMPQSIEELQKCVQILDENGYPFYIMGNGSNILVDDDGVRGAVIKLADGFDEVNMTDGEVVAKSGMLLSTLAKQISAKGYKGFEFATGIPGSLGGAITMNAGAYGGEMKDVVRWVKVMDHKGNIETHTLEEMNFGYRQSIILSDDLIVLEVGMSFEEGVQEEINEVIKDLTYKRTSKQPLELPSAGSTFKRPPGHYAGKLIQDANLRGIRFNDAMVSEKHCGFVVNMGQATCKDVLTLIETVQKVVKDTFGVELEREVRIFSKE